MPENRNAEQAAGKAVSHRVRETVWILPVGAVGFGIIGLAGGGHNVHDYMLVFGASVGGVAINKIIYLWVDP